MIHKKRPPSPVSKVHKVNFIKLISQCLWKSSLPSYFMALGLHIYIRLNTESPHRNLVGHSSSSTNKNIKYSWANMWEGTGKNSTIPVPKKWQKILCKDNCFFFSRKVKYRQNITFLSWPFSIKTRNLWKNKKYNLSVKALEKYHKMLWKDICFYFREKSSIVKILIF